MEGDERRSGRKRVMTEKAREGKEQEINEKKQRKPVSDAEGSTGTMTNQVEEDTIKLEENLEDSLFVFSRPQNTIETFLRNDNDEDIRLLNLVS